MTPEALISDLVAAFSGDSPKETATEILERALASRKALLAALDPPRGLHSRRLHSSPQLTVDFIVWPPGIQTPPHEHGMWALIGICAGREANGFHRREGDRIVQAGGRVVEEGEVAFLPADVIHGVSNDREETCIGIHVYAGDLGAQARSFWSPADGRPYPLDERMHLRAAEMFNGRMEREAEPFTLATGRRVMMEVHREMAELQRRMQQQAQGAQGTALPA